MNIKCLPLSYLTEDSWLIELCHIRTSPSQWSKDLPDGWYTYGIACIIVYKGVRYKGNKEDFDCAMRKANAAEMDKRVIDAYKALHKLSPKALTSSQRQLARLISCGVEPSARNISRAMRRLPLGFMWTPSVVNSFSLVNFFSYIERNAAFRSHRRSFFCLAT